MPDCLQSQDSFGVDHYKPKARFPAAVTEYGNLFYACNSCNRRKGEFWPTERQLDDGHFIPNPCDHVMFQHLRSKPDGTIVDHTNAGRWAIELLDLNDPNVVAYRKGILAAIRMARQTRSKCETALQKLTVQLDAAPQGHDVSPILEKVRELEAGLKDAETALRWSTCCDQRGTDQRGTGLAITHVCVQDLT